MACLHDEIHIEHNISICMCCGEELGTVIEDTWIQNSHFQVRKVADKNIYKDLEHFNISSDVKDLANEIYVQVCKTATRQKYRTGIIFAAVFYAYKLTQNPQRYDTLVQMLKVKKKDALKGLKFINDNIPENSPIRTAAYITPVHLIKEFMTKLNASDQEKENVIDIYNVVKSKSIEINRSRPQSIAAGIIYYYKTFILNNSINMKEFKKYVGLSELTIHKISDECKRVLSIKDETE
jgi:transcription initiation factor TFIIIB Brf1 subunit/transcription initiation factor TFIIB